MGNREAYNTCMIPHISGHHEDRKGDFCVGAKICSGKAADEPTARKLCAEAAANPKPPKEKRARGKGKIDIAALATCVVGALEGKEITIAALVPILSSCTGQKVETPSRIKFIRKCRKEKSVTGDMKEAYKLGALCASLWKDQEAA